MALTKNIKPEGVKEYNLSWVDPLDPNYLYSKMFDGQVDAVYFIQTLDKKFDYMLFKFVSLGERGYTWELLPYGAYKSYTYGMIISEYIIAILLGIIIIYLIIK